MSRGAGRRAADGPAGRRLVSPLGVALAIGGAVLLCWPMLLLGGPLLFRDSPTYLAGGEVIWETTRALLLSRLETGADATGAGAAVEPEGAAALSQAAASAWAVRSAPYALFAYLTASTPLGLLGPILLQGAAVLLLLFALLDREPLAPRRDVALAAGACATLTTLPWFSAFLMPDVLAAAVVLWAMLVARGLDAFDWAQRGVLVALAAGAIVSHYGHIPLAAATVAAALGLRLLARRLTVLAVGVGLAPLALAAGTNALVGAIAFDGPSLAPRRLPLLLARSIEDGPARWHLEARCPDGSYAVCEVFADGIPTNVGEAMWAEGGLRHASTELLTRVRAEEPLILWRAFLEHPVAQIASLTGNMAEQFVLVGGGGFRATALSRAPEGGFRFERGPPQGWIEALGAVQTVIVLASALFLAALAASGRLTRGERDLVLVLAVGLAVNAAVFGGLSAPDPRYQARLAWLVPATAALVWLRMRAARADLAAPRSEADGSRREATEDLAASPRAASRAPAER